MSRVIPSHAIYQTLMAEAKIRILASENILLSPQPITGTKALDTEICFLQIRQIIESITFGCLVREEGRYTALRKIEKSKNSRDHGDSSKDWQAPEILKRLITLSPHALPIPIKKASEIGAGSFHLDRKRISANHDRLIDLYSRSSGYLHAQNPICKDFAAQVETQRSKYVSGHLEAEKAIKFLRDLLWHHAVVNIESPSSDNPLEPASPSHAWIIDFGATPESEVEILIAEAV